MISQTAQYALRAIVCLALKPTVSMTTSQLAEMTKVSVEYLAKVMQALVRADLVTSKPGKMGGFLLRKEACDISLLEVIEAIEPLHIGLFPLEIQGYGNVLCPLHQKLNQINAQVRQEFSSIHINALLSQ